MSTTVTFTGASLGDYEPNTPIGTPATDRPILNQNSLTLSNSMGIGHNLTTGAHLAIILSAITASTTTLWQLFSDATNNNYPTIMSPAGLKQTLVNTSQWAAQYGSSITGSYTNGVCSITWTCSAPMGSNITNVYMNISYSASMAPTYVSISLWSSQGSYSANALSASGYSKIAATPQPPYIPVYTQTAPSSPSSTTIGAYANGVLILPLGNNTSSSVSIGAFFSYQS